MGSGRIRPWAIGRVEEDRHQLEEDLGRWTREREGRKGGVYAFVLEAFAVIELITTVHVNDHLWPDALFRLVWELVPPLLALQPPSSLL